MTRKTKLLLNTSTSFIYQLTVIACGFILPKLFLTYYGSEVNGLVSSITQFLGFIALCECGVGAVVQSTLYKPLAENDTLAISQIVVSSDRFFRKLAYLLVAYVLLLMIIYPFITIKSFGYFYTMQLIFVISINTFAQYYFGMTNRLLLIADQLGFLQYSLQTVLLILNTISCVVLIKHSASIQLVKLVTSLIFMMQPFILMLVVKRAYNIDRKIKLTEEPIKQKWNGLSQHIASVVLQNTDIVVLTLFSSLKNVSIYAVYNLIVTGIKQIILALTNGVQSMYGNMLAKDEMEELNSNFSQFEWIMHTCITLIFTVTSVLILPFVMVYTKGVSDANYNVPAFAYLIVCAQAAYCMRLPYNIMVLAAGHYRQTQTSAIIEATINVVLSIALVFAYGLVGVAIGTFVAMMYRTIYFVIYLSKNILKRQVAYFIRHIFADVLVIALVVLTVNVFCGWFTMGDKTYVSWTILAAKTGLVTLIFSLCINFVLYKDLMMKFFKKSTMK